MRNYAKKNQCARQGVWALGPFGVGPLGLFSAGSITQNFIFVLMLINT
jgi:hypothetical protein